MKRDKVEWAKSYPFPRPKQCYVYIDGAAHELAHYSLDDFGKSLVNVAGSSVPLAHMAPNEHLPNLCHVRRRHAVIACGSNASPERLRQKFGDEGILIPTLEVVVEGYCIVYAARFTQYGSVPTTLAKAPGAHMRMHVNLLDDNQLELMDRSETLGVSYNRWEIEGVSLTLGNGDSLDSAHAYFNRNGALFVDKAVLAPSGIEGVTLRHRVLGQADVQGVAKSLLDVDASIDDFIHENIENQDLRLQRNNVLRENYSIPLDEPLGETGEV